MGADALAGDMRPRPLWAASALVAVAVAIVALGAGLFLAWHHPLWPTTATAVFTAWVVVAARRPGLWLFLLPAALPLLNFSPWTGWLVFEEFDLLVLGAIAGGFARLAWHADSAFSATLNPVRWPLRWSTDAVLAFGFGALGLLGLFRGVADAGGWTLGWFDGYSQPLNGLRVGKSLFYALALWPLLNDEFQRSTPRAIQRLARGMQVGLTLVGLAVLWERAAFPGLLDFSSRYRTTAMFWEMHVGGAAIDAYLALATPFAAWALWSARSRRDWVAAAFLALLTGHACLTTFSRGVYVAVAVPLLLLGIGWWLRRLRSSTHAAALGLARILLAAAVSAVLLIVAFVALGYAGLALALTILMGLLLVLRLRVRSLRWRHAAAMALTLALMTEAVAVIGGGSFMRSRLDASEDDFGSRVAHWRHGLDLLNSPMDWLVGLGLGRLPANYAQRVPESEFSGAVALISTQPDSHAVQLSGPATREDLAGLYALTQRVSLHAGGAYQVRLRTRVASATVISLDVCEQHLLYTRQCKSASVRVAPHDRDWQEITTTLNGPALSAGRWYAPRLGVFSLAVTDFGASADLAAVSLIAPDGSELLANREFSAGLAHWFPSAQSYFLPWHIDNLYLELLIERGVLGLALFVGLAGRALSRFLQDDAPQIAPILAASLFGALLVGSISSVMDVPRVAFLLLLLVFVSRFGHSATAERTTVA